MNRIVKVATTAAAAIGIAATGVSVAQPAGAPAPQALNGTDANFLRTNEQVNLAEITLAAIELKRATGPAAINLARKTGADHLVTRAVNIKLSGEIGVSLPTKPNAMQQQVAAFLSTAVRVNQQYFVAQIAGHKQSIASTKYEIQHGIRPRVVAYAKAYLPIATMHLEMAEHDLAVWNSLFG